MEKKVRTQLSFEIDASLRKELNLVALEMDMPMKDIVTMLITKFLEVNKQERLAKS